jgi:iron complex outermembrane receptor protein
MFELKPIARHLLLACGGLAGALMIASPASAQQPAGQEQKLERITITGSNIRRTDTETVAPIEIISREDIEKSGKATVAEVLRAIPANAGNSYSESFSNSFAPGASGV